MKKLVVMMLGVTMSLCLAACGGAQSSSNDAPAESAPVESTPEPESSAPEGSAEGTADIVETEPEAAGAGEVDVSAVLAFMEGQDMVTVPDNETLAGTDWGFTGGSSKGQEMDEETVNALLEVYGGQLGVSFGDGQAVAMVQGGGQLNGTYTVVGDGNVVAMEFDNSGTPLPYLATFTDIDGTIGMMLFGDGNTETVCYFTQNEG